MSYSNDFYTLLQQSILSQEPHIEPYLHLPPQGSIKDRIAIYADGFYGRLEETLASDYPVLAALIGENEFCQLSQKYVTAYPSTSYSLNFLGQHLSKFLAETTPYDQKPFLAEIAAYEWAEGQAFTSADSTLLTATELHNVPADQWPGMIFHLHPSCHLMQMHWNSLSLINAIRSGYKHPPRAKKLTTAESVLIWRRQLQVRYFLLDDLELCMLQAINHHASFMEICAHLSHKIADVDVPGYLVKKLYVWLEEQLLVPQPKV